MENKIIFNDSSPWSFDLKSAKGCLIYTTDDKELIDFTSGWNVTNLGWNNPEVSEAIITQAKIHTYTPMWSDDSTQLACANALTAVLPGPLQAVSRATGGTEANEEALKTARAFTGRKKIIGFKDTYHGQSFGTMSIGYRPEYVTGISPLVPDFIQLDFPSSPNSLPNFEKVLEQALSKKDVAAIVTEAGIITGWGSTYVAPGGYLTLVRKLTKKYGTLMILDEVGTGFSRCGKLFGMEIENVIPDIATFAKGMSNGAAAIGAMVTTKEIAEGSRLKSNLTSTFGWVPISCAVAVKVLEIHRRDKVWDKAFSSGKFLVDLLNKSLLGNPRVGDIRGYGLEIGVDILNDSKQPDSKLAESLIKAAFQNGLHLTSAGGGNLQIMPPLIIDKPTLEEGIHRLVKSFESIQYSPTQLGSA